MDPDHSKNVEQFDGTASSGNTGSDEADPVVKSTGRKSRAFCLTIFDQEIFEKTFKHDTNVRYQIAGKEVAPTTGKVHWQCYLYYTNPRRLTAVIKRYKPSHVEIAMGTPSQNKLYCSKDGDIWEAGKIPDDQGKGKLAEVLDQYDNLDDILTEEPELFCRYRNGIREIMEAKAAKNRFFKRPIVEWLHGPTGCGKSKYAFEKGCVPVSYNNGFFSDWGNAKKIVLEEMRGEIPYPILLKLLDGYHNYYNVNIKGGHKLIDLDMIIITSPFKPEDIYIHQLEKKDSINQLLRRINWTCNMETGEYDNTNESETGDEIILVERTDKDQYETFWDEYEKNLI